MIHCYEDVGDLACSNKVKYVAHLYSKSCIDKHNTEYYNTWLLCEQHAREAREDGDVLRIWSYR